MSLTTERTDRIMMARILRVIALAALVTGASASPSLHASGAEINRTQYLTFSGAVALPGVALNPGTYIFELAAPESSPDVVRVTSRDRKIVYFTEFTRQVGRPSSVPMAALVSLQETAKNEPAPIAVWWSDAQTGRQFLYAR